MSSLRQKLKDFFIPHEGNDHRPHFFGTKSVVTIIAIVMVVEFAYLAQVFIVFKKTDFLAAVLPGVLINLTNTARAENSAGSLTSNALLTQAANKKAGDMAQKGYFSHITPDGKTPWYWLKLVGYQYSYAGENLAVNFTDSDEVLRAWMQSPTHRENIVKKEYTEIGIGVAEGQYQGRDATFVVQFFATPATSDVPQNSSPVKNPSTASGAKVLGAETGPAAAISYFATIPQWLATHIIADILALVFLALLLGIVVKVRVQHPHVFIRGLALVILILLVSIFNKEIVASVKITAGGESATTASY